jgi:hypothetical protein
MSVKSLMRHLKHILVFVGLLAFATLLSGCTNAMQQISLPNPKPLDPDDPKGLKLPPGVPRTVDTNGNVTYIDISFTTRQYRQAAVELMLQEANRVAREMQLPEELPITKSNLTEAMVTPFGFNYTDKGIGSVTTKNYAYFVTKDNKFNELVVANYDQTCLNLERQSRPIEQMSTNEAYQLATQWLTAVSMDVSGLNRDCTAHVALSPYWNGLTTLGQKPSKNFVPIYYVWWTSPKNDAEGYGGVARVELFSPTKKLLQLSIDDPKYILRKPVVFTNLDSLFPGTAPITVFTNYPVNTRPVREPRS